MLRKFLTVMLLVAASLEAAAWGRLGHDAIAYIAERHLTPTAKARIEGYLGNHSIVYYASWMDMVRYTPEYSHSGRWHASNIDSLGRYIPGNEYNRRDAVEGLNITMAKLRDYKTSSDSAVAADIKLLVHIVGDMHCPGHAFWRGYDQKGIKFSLNGTRMQVHNFWDSACLNHHEWNYLEFGHQLDRYTDEEIADMVKGTPADWVSESGTAIAGTYDWFEQDAEYSGPQTSAMQLKAEEIAHPRIVKAGYRLASLLNAIFDNKDKIDNIDN